MTDHLALPVFDYACSRAFHAPQMRALGDDLLVEADPARTGSGEPSCCFDLPGEPRFRIDLEPGVAPAHVGSAVATGGHVHAFQAAGLATGGRDDGAPGVRLYYRPHDCAAFVLDPDGRDIDAVRHAPGPH